MSKIYDRASYISLGISKIYYWVDSLMGEDCLRPHGYEKIREQCHRLRRSTNEKY